MTIIRRNLLQFCVCIVCVAGGLMVVSFSKSIADIFLLPCCCCFKDKNCFSSHTSHHDWLGVYCFPSKLWVPTNFHTGSLELYYQDILDILELWKQSGWRDVVFVSDSIYSAVYSVWGQVYITVHCCILTLIDVCIKNWYNSLF